MKESEIKTFDEFEQEINRLEELITDALSQVVVGIKCPLQMQIWRITIPLLEATEVADSDREYILGKAEVSVSWGR